MKVFAYWILVLSGLAALLWPLAAFSSIFLFDAPSGTFYFEVHRYALAIGILSYPWGFLVGWPESSPGKKVKSGGTDLRLLFF